MCVGFVVLLRSGGSFLIGGRHKYVTLFPQRRKYLGFIDFSFFLLPLVTKHPPPITTPSPLDATFHGLSPTMWFEGGWSLGFFAVERKVTFWVLSAKIKKTSEKHTFPSCHDTPRWPRFFIHTWGTLWTMAHTMPHAAGLGDEYWGRTNLFCELFWAECLEKMTCQSQRWLCLSSSVVHTWQDVIRGCDLPAIESPGRIVFLEVEIARELRCWSEKFFADPKLLKIFTILHAQPHQNYDNFF